MSQKYVPANVFLKCDKGVTPCQLKVLRPGPDLYDEKWAVESDAVPMLNIGTFGVCTITRTPCVPATVRWQNTLIGALQIEIGGLSQNPLLDNSFLPCTLGGKIDIFFTRADVSAALQAEEDARQIEAAEKLSEDAKETSLLLFGAAILVAAVVVVATGGAALSLIAGAAAAGAAVGGGVGAVAGGMSGYASGGWEGAAKGAAVGLVGGAVMGAVGGAAAVAGGPLAVGLLEASAASFAVGAAADGFKFYKQPTLANGLVLLSDVVILAGGRLAESRARSSKKLETSPGAAKKQCTCAKDPVDVASGAMFFDAVDVALPGPIPFLWERTWYSTSTRQGPLGYGWHHRYDLALWPDLEAGTVAMRLDDGKLGLFEAPSADNDYWSFYRPRKLELRPLPAGEDGYSVHSLDEQLTYHFLPNPQQAGHYRLTAIVDGYDHALRFTYSPDGHLQTITDSVGRIVQVESDEDGRILALHLPHPDGKPGTFLAVRYRYNEAGDMTAATNAEGHTRSFQYEDHRLVQKTFATGMSYYYEYDAQGRCTRTWGDENYYNGRFVYEPGKTTLHTDDPAAVDVYYHEQGLVTTHLNSLGFTHHKRYNLYAELEEEQDATGHTTQIEYDEQGNRTRVTHADGACIQTQYNAQGQPTQLTDANGHAWQWVYGDRHELLTRTDPAGAVMAYRYDEHGRVSEMQDALGHATHFRYDLQHNLAHIVSPDQQVRSRTHDALGRLISLTDARGNVQRRRYDRLGQLVAVQEPDGRETFVTYDGDGNPIRAQDGAQDVQFAYTAVNRLAVRRQAGEEVHFHYDREARLVRVTNEQGLHYDFTLDAAGHVVAEQGFDGLLRHYQRDPAGRVTMVHRPQDRITQYTYDPAGRVTAVHYSEDTYEQYTYDAAGSLLEAVNQDAVIRLTRDSLGRVVQEAQGDHTLTHRYDVRGQRTNLSSTLGASLDLRYDVLGGVEAMRAGSWEATFLRDADGLELQRRLSGGVQASWQRDALGRPSSQRVLAAAGQRQRQYVWQGNDQLVEIHDSLNGRTQFRYDDFGALSETRYADGTEELRLPDAIGNLFRTPDRMDRTYGKGGQLRQANGTRYRYDAEGNLIKKILSNGQQWDYSWNGAGLLASVKRPDGYRVTFTYDAFGRRISKRFRGRVTRWVWDGNKPLHEWSALEVSFGAESAQNVITWLFDEHSFAPAAKLTAQGSYSVVTDHLGTPLELYDGQGQKTWQAHLDSYGGVREGRGKPQDCPFRYQGQYEDVETGLYYNRFRYYSPEDGVYISQDPIGLLGGIGLYAYCENPLATIDPFGLTPTPPQLPDKVIYNQDGVRVWHNYGNMEAGTGTPVEHAPIHYHAKYQGKEYRAFPSGKPLKDSAPLPTKVKEVFRENRSRFQRIEKRIGGWFREVIEGGKEGCP